MTIEELLVFAKEHIHSDLSKMILGELINKNPLELYNHLEEKVSDEIANTYKKAIFAIKEGKPIQYVLGNVNFYGIRYYINENVLIPRFETEELVEETIKYINKLFTEPVEIIDLGCGSGVIGLTLEQKVSPKSVDLIDISEKALEVAKKNCENLNSKANIIQSDMFEKINKKYDVIISNPPYIRNNEEIETIVKDNEPHLALYGGEDGLDSYRKIIKNINNYTKDKCLICFEIGNKQADELTKIINEYMQNVKIEVKKDLSDRDRMLFIFKNFE